MSDDTHTSRMAMSLRRLIPALVLILVGIFFLLNNLGVTLPWVENWWAWVILLVALWPLSRAIFGYRQRGRWDAAALRDLFNAAFLILIAVMFLLHLAWAIWWPLFMIYGGVYMLMRQRDRQS